jgi:hypothetical protein
MKVKNSRIVLTIAHLIKVHFDLWPWFIFRGHLKVTNVKIAYVFLTVRDRHMITMQHYLDVII